LQWENRELAEVTINGPGVITGQFNYTAPDGSVITFYGWTFSVTVNGQVGVYTVWIDSNTNEAAAAAGAIEDLEADPGALGGIAENDGADQDEGSIAENDGIDQGDFGDDDDDGELADGGGGDDAGESA
jgi:hypothetical protein